MFKFIFVATLFLIFVRSVNRRRPSPACSSISTTADCATWSYKECMNGKIGLLFGPSKYCEYVQEKTVGCVEGC